MGTEQDFSNQWNNALLVCTKVLELEKRIAALEKGKTSPIQNSDALVDVFENYLNGLDTSSIIPNELT